MTLVKNILGIVPGLQAVALLNHNLKLIPKINSKLTMRQQTSKFLKTGVGTIVGVGLIKPTASMINKL